MLAVIGAMSIVAKADQPVLVSEATSTRAIALESVIRMREPFPLTQRFAFSQDARTRVMLFALNLELQPGEEPSSVITADAEDAAHRHYALKVEYAGKVPGQERLTQLILRLNDEMQETGDVLVGIAYGGVASNRVRIGIGYLGGGPADDNGAIPTPASSSYSIMGHVRDAGTPLAGVTVTLSGFASGSTLTDSDGKYSFDNLPIAGSYTLSASKQPWVFSPPNRTFYGLFTNKVADFGIADPFRVLEFDGSPQTVDYGFFWPNNLVNIYTFAPDNTLDLGHFFWEFWAMPGAKGEGRYLLSDGNGGAHALLFGFGFFNQEGRYTFTGNVWNGTAGISFGSDDGPAQNEWGHFAVGWDGRNIITYFNGVPVGKKAFAGPRREFGAQGGGGPLYIGGSDHQNFLGRLAQVRGYEGSNPREDPSGNGGELASFAPQLVFGGLGSGNLLSNFFRPAQNIADLSAGYLEGYLHVGRLRGTNDACLYYGCSTLPVPQYVVDPASPNTSTGTKPISPAVKVDAPLPVPSRARVFDSFSRKSSTYAFDGGGGLGSTEGGTAGRQVWQTNQPTGVPSPFGILNGRAVMLQNQAYAAWVPTGSTAANLDIRVDRIAIPRFYGTGISTGLVFRVQDGKNFLYAYTTGDGERTQTLRIGYFLNGVESVIDTGIALPSIWKTLRVVTSASGGIKVYAEFDTDSTLVYSTTSPALKSATGAGIYNFSAGQGLANRWDNFTVYDAP